MLVQALAHQILPGKLAEVAPNVKVNSKDTYEDGLILDEDDANVN